MVLLAGGSKPCRDIPRALDAKARVGLGTVPESVEPTGRFYHEHDVADNRQARLLEPRTHGEDRLAVLSYVAQGSAEAERKLHNEAASISTVLNRNDEQ